MVTLLNRNPAAHVELNSPVGVKDLLRQLRWADASSQTTMLVGRIGAQVDLGTLVQVSELIKEMHECGATRRHLVTLADRIAAHADVSGFHGAGTLPGELKRDGFCSQADELISRLPAAGHFHSFIRWSPVRERFCFGRETDGSPAAPWRWNDVEPDGDSTESGNPAA
jgi:hypothetical protein